ACPDDLWTSNVGSRQFWHMAYHTLFFTDLNLSGELEGFAPPTPFTRSELDPTNVLPDRVYTKDEVLEYVRHCREKGRSTFAALTDLEAVRMVDFTWVRMKFGELMLYTIRHIQHHGAQLNLALRQSNIDPPDWVGRAAE